MKKFNQTTSGQWTMSKPWPPKITEEPVVTTMRPQITMVPRQPSTTDKASLPLSKSTTKPTVTTLKTTTTLMPSQPSTTDKSSLPPCTDIAEITDYSDHDLDIGKIVIKNQEQQIPGVTCQELPLCPDLSDFSDDGVDIGELGGRTPKNLIPGVTCKVIQVMPVPFLIPVQEEPELITQEPQTNKNPEISTTFETQIPITENPQVSITEKSQIKETEEKPVPFLIAISERPQVATNQEPPKSKTPKVPMIEDTQIPKAENPQILITKKSQPSDTETSQTFKTMPIQPTTGIQAPSMVLTPKVTIDTELPPCIKTFDSPDYSDYNLDVGTIVVTNLEQQIPGVTCQKLPPCPDISDYSDGTVSIGELGGRNPENLIPGVTCNINKVTPVSFLVPIQEKPQVITTEQTQTSKNPQISKTEDNQIPITENPQISITDLSQIADTKLPQISNPIPTQPTRVIQAPKPTTKPSVSTFKTPTTMMPSQTSTTIKLNADEESQIFSDDAVPFLDYDYEYEYDGIVVAEYMDIISIGDISIYVSY